MDENIRRAEELDRPAREAYDEAVVRALEAQESGTKLSRAFFENWVKVLEDQAELNRRTLDGLHQLVQAQREVFKDLSQESVEAYDNFLHSLDDYEHRLDEKEAESGSDEDYLLSLERTGELRRGSGRLPDDFWDRPRPKDPEGLVRSAVHEDRR